MLEPPPPAPAEQGQESPQPRALLVFHCVGASLSSTIPAWRGSLWKVEICCISSVIFTARCRFPRQALGQAPTAEFCLPVACRGRWHHEPLLSRRRLGGPAACGPYCCAWGQGVLRSAHIWEKLVRALVQIASKENQLKFHLRN